MLMGCTQYMILLLYIFRIVLCSTNIILIYLKLQITTKLFCTSTFWYNKVTIFLAINKIVMIKYYIKKEIPTDGKTKKKILSCIFSGKVIFEKRKVAANSFWIPVQVLINTSKVLEDSKYNKEVEIDLLERCNYNAMFE